MKGHCIQSCVKGGTGNQFRALGPKCFHFFALFLITAAGHLLHDLLELLAQSTVNIAGIDIHIAFAIQAAGSGDTLAIRAVIHTKDSPRHGSKPSDQIGVVANHTLGLAHHAVDLRGAICCSDQYLVAKRVSGDGLNPSPEGARGDGSNVVHKALGGHFGQLCGLIPPH